MERHRQPLTSLSRRWSDNIYLEEDYEKFIYELLEAVDIFDFDEKTDKQQRKRYSFSEDSKKTEIHPSQHYDIKMLKNSIRKQKAQMKVDRGNCLMSNHSRKYNQKAGDDWQSNKALFYLTQNWQESPQKSKRNLSV